MKILNSQIGTSASDIKPTARGSRLHSIYYLMVEANLAAACTCCSNLPIVKQPILIFPFIPIDYMFKAPPNWAPVIMPMKVFQVSLGGLGVSMGGMGMNVQMNMPSVPPPSVNVSYNVPPPNVGMNVNMNSTNGNVSMYSSTGSVNMQMNVPPPTVSMHMNVPSTGMNMQMSGPGINSSHHYGATGHVGVGMQVQGGFGVNAKMY